MASLEVSGYGEWVRVSSAGILVVSLVALASACASVYVTDGVDANAPDAETFVPPAPVDPVDGGGTSDAAPGPADADTDATTFTFADDFERSDAAIVPPWSSVSVRSSRLAIGTPDGGNSRVLFAETTPADDTMAWAEKRYTDAVVRRATITFSVRIGEFLARDGGGTSGETANLFSLRSDTVPTDAGAGPEHVVRIGIRRKSPTTFAVFVMSQFNPGQVRSVESTTLLDKGTKYDLRLDVDITTPQPGKAVAIGYVNGTRAVSLDGAGERVYGYLPGGRFFFPGAVEGGGFQLEMDELSVVGTR